MSNTADVFNKISGALAANPGAAESINAVFQFNVTGDNGGTWVIDARPGSAGVSEGASADAQCQITIADSDWVALTSGKANPMNMFMMGKIKLSGDMGLAMKLQGLLKLAA